MNTQQPDSDRHQLVAHLYSNAHTLAKRARKLSNLEIFKTSHGRTADILISDLRKLIQKMDDAAEHSLRTGERLKETKAPTD